MAKDADKPPSHRVLWLIVVIVLLFPIPIGDQPWFFSGILFRAFELLNSQLPENF